MERRHNLLIAHEIPNPKLKTDRETEVRVQRYVPTTRRGSETLNTAESKVTDLPGESPKWNPGTHLQSATCYQQRVANSNTSATQKQRAESDFTREKGRRNSEIGNRKSLNFPEIPN